MDNILISRLNLSQTSSRKFEDHPLKDIDDLTELEPVVVASSFIAMKFEQTTFLYLEHILEKLSLKFSLKQIYFYERTILEFLSWKVAQTNIYTVWNQH